MKYLILFSGVLCLLFTGCKKDKPQTAAGQLADDSVILQLNDSITNLTASFQSDKDTALLVQALDLSDKVLKLDQTEEGQYYGTLRKIQILALSGRKKDAFILQDAITNKDPDSVERLIYNGLTAKMAKQDNAADLYFSKALDQCNKRLILTPSDADLSITVSTIYMYQGKKDEASKAIDKALVALPDNELLLDFKANIDNTIVQLHKFIND